MRVIAGRYKRRPLETPEGFDITRPTGDRVKESLFNILAPTIPEARVLDLFSGSGALGIEALSRGATSAVFVDSHPQACACILRNLRKMGVPESSFALFQCDVETFLRGPQNRWRKAGQADPAPGSFDILMADPPYASAWYNSSLEAIERSQLCRSGARVVLERSRAGAEVTAPSEKWSRYDIREYGSVALEFWRWSPEERVGDDTEESS